MRVKAGREYVDPLNRRVYVKEVKDGVAICRLKGPYAATVYYPITCLREET
jgi:hypothetical protein